MKIYLATKTPLGDTDYLEVDTTETIVDFTHKSKSISIKLTKHNGDYLSFESKEVSIKSFIPSYCVADKY